MHQVAIYGLFDPRNGLCRYVGHTSNPRQRLLEHLYDVDNSPRGIWIHELQSDGIIPILKVFQRVEVEQVYQAEVFWVNFLRWLGVPITNELLVYDRHGYPRHGGHIKREKLASCPVDHPQLKQIVDICPETVNLDRDDLHHIMAYIHNANIQNTSNVDKSDCIVCNHKNKLLINNALMEGMPLGLAATKWHVSVMLLKEHLPHIEKFTGAFARPIPADEAHIASDEAGECLCYWCRMSGYQRLLNAWAEANTQEKEAFAVKTREFDVPF